MFTDNPNVEISGKENKQELLADEIKDARAFKEKLFKLYKEEFEDFIGPILLMKEANFMRFFYQRMHLIIQDMYSNEAFELPTFVQTINETEKHFFQECYKKSYTILSKGWSDLEKTVQEANKNPRMKSENILRSSTVQEKPSFNSKSTDVNSKPAISIPPNSTVIYLKSFHKHCKQNEIAIHKCKGRFIPVFDEYNLTHVICVNCKYSYFSSSILMFCNECQKEFYSYFASSFDKEYQPATWEKYHCGAVVNDQMKCIKCKDKFFIKLKDGKLFCKSCKFVADPLSIIWQCIFCMSEFRSKAKIYNPMEYKLIKMAIKNALLFKKQIRPNSIPCCNGDPSQLTFFHNAECNGMLYTSDLSEKKVIVCNSCRAICQDSKFTWTCPLCMKTFRDDSLHNQITGRDDYSFKITTKPSQETDEYFVTKDPHIHQSEASFKKNKNISFYVNKSQEDPNDPEYEFPNNSNQLRSNPLTKPKFGNAIDKFKKISGKRKTFEQLLSPKGQKAVKCFSIINPTKNIENDFSRTIGPKQDITNFPLQGTRPGSSLLRSPKPMEKEEILGKGYIKVITLDKKNIPTSNCEDRNKLPDGDEKIDTECLPAPRERETALSPGVESKKNSISGKLKDFDFEDYTVVTQIGEGSFGKIYLVEDAQKKVYSMKKIIVNDECELEFIVQEYELVNQLRHPHILKIIALCKRQLDATTFVIYILMEVSLSDWEKEIKERQEMKQYYSESELIVILQQLVYALAFLQKKSISHRDIKPQNILIFRDSLFKIADFGEAKQLAQMESNKEFSTLRGTELYMSPLLFNALRTTQNDIKHNPYKSDVFSLGFCVLYAATLSITALYDCRKMYDSKSIAGYLKKILQVRYSRQFIDLLSKMLEINEQNRYDFLGLEEVIQNMNN